jgi:hypothetical protein
MNPWRAKNCNLSFGHRQPGIIFFSSTHVSVHHKWQNSCIRSSTRIISIDIHHRRVMESWEPDNSKNTMKPPMSSNWQEGDSLNWKPDALTHNLGVGSLCHVWNFGVVHDHLKPFGTCKAGSTSRKNINFVMMGGHLLILIGSTSNAVCVVKRERNRKYRSSLSDGRPYLRDWIEWKTNVWVHDRGDAPTQDFRKGVKPGCLGRLRRNCFCQSKACD